MVVAVAFERFAECVHQGTDSLHSFLPSHFLLDFKFRIDRNSCQQSFGPITVIFEIDVDSNVSDFVEVDQFRIADAKELSVV